MTAFDNDRWEAARKDRLSRTAPVQEPTLLERCRLALFDAIDKANDVDTFDADLTRAVLTTLRDGTGSLRTAEEIDRVLGEGA